MKFPNTTFFYSFSKWQNSAIKAVTYSKMPATKIKLGYKVIKTIILIFSVPKSQNSNEEEKNLITPKAIL